MRAGLCDCEIARCNSHLCNTDRLIFIQIIECMTKIKYTAMHYKLQAAALRSAGYCHCSQVVVAKL